MKIIKSFLVIAFTLFMFLSFVGCGDSSDGIRIKNSSTKELKSLTIGATSYGDLKVGEMSEYQSVDAGRVPVNHMTDGSLENISYLMIAEGSISITVEISETDTGKLMMMVRED